MSIAKENFIKTIYQLDQSQEQNAKPGNVARALGISNAAATDMARKLADRELLQYRKYQELKLTDQGTSMALSILRKHRLWETFLHQTFGLSLHEIHREAELLEHQTSDFLAEKLASFLGEPQFDPHGDPIPGKNGEITTDDKETLLSKAQPEKVYRVSRLSSSEKEFFDFCSNNKIAIGSEIEVVNQYPKNAMTEVQTLEGKLLLNHDIAHTIFVIPTE